MNRRQVLSTGLAAAGFAAVIPKLAHAQATGPEKKIDVQVAIGTNHGHALALGAADALELLRQTVAAPVTLDIKGGSNHGHPLVLSHESLLQLFVEGKIDVQATGAHTHLVTIILDVV